MTGSTLAALVALVVPPGCAACRGPVASADRRLCATCVRALPWLPRRACARCALPSHRRGCPAAGAAFARAWAPLAYEGVARELVGALKFHGALPLAELMAAHIAANLPPELRRGLPEALIAVPPQRSRARRRGFDPAAALAAALAPRLGLEPRRCLRRRDHARQVGASRSQRRRDGRIAVEAHGAAPARALLIDDVHTTGATLDACARALRAAGCREVVALTYARTL